jgi:hypothetical protein
MVIEEEEEEESLMLRKRIESYLDHSYLEEGEVCLMM